MSTSRSGGALFAPDRSRLYPQFETYRLHPLSPTDNVLSFPLPGSGATQSRLEHGYHTLSFKETRDRIGWDHLSMDESGRGVYIDKEWNVVGFELDDDLSPSFTILASLSQPISTTSSSSSSSAPAPEYPSAVSLQPGLWAISSGSGSLYILHTSADHSAGEIVATYALPNEANSPFIIRASHCVSETEARLLLSRSIPDPSAEVDGKEKGRSIKRVFELLEVVLDPTMRSGDESRDLEVAWKLVGEDLPVHCAWQEGAGWLVLSSETYSGAVKADRDSGLNEVEREKKERDARIGKLGLGASLPPQDPEVSVPLPQAVSTPGTISTIPDQPLFWTQTGDSASIRIPLAAGTVRSDYTLSLRPSSLNFTLDSRSEQSALLTQFARYPEHSWWADIDPELSSFSFDPRTSTLEIDITKVDSNHRWPSLFLPSDDDDDLSDIPETLSADVLASVREAFNNIRTRGPDEPEGNHPAIPSLLREEMDFDMEDGEDFEDRAAGAMGDGSGKVGREIFVGMLDGGNARWSAMTTTVISLPIQGGGEGVMVKSAVDGLLYSPSADPTAGAWTHQATTPALAFVLSSKRDIRLVRHFTAGTADQPTVLAFDSGSSSAGQGNVYVYYPPVDKLTAKQGVVRVSGLERGAALGVARVRRRYGEDVVVVLCEKELVVLDGVV